mmetsp:Transcript_38355/g.86317  ORF Transcript_38355/g.86317 Transcript_38355/m.86317 type:complete len:168 (+) Transcript_38355:143-646(+)
MVSRSRRTLFLAALVGVERCSGFGMPQPQPRSRSACADQQGRAEDTGRREALGLLSAIAATAAVAAPAALALDFDAFESSAITPPPSNTRKLTDDEALCIYGAPGKEMGEACARSGAKPKLPKSVSPTGKADRGDYLACKYEYPKDKNGEYVKTRVCKPSKEWTGAD